MINRVGPALALLTALAARAAAVPAQIPGEPVEDSALQARDQADPQGALTFWEKAVAPADADGFLWNQRGWSFLAAGRTADARSSFLKAIDRSSTTASQAEANLGLGLTAWHEGKPKAAAAPLRQATVEGPYLLSSVSYETALTASARKDSKTALAYLTQSLNLDPLNLESLRELARFEERLGEKRAAWMMFHRLLSLDSHDQEAAAKISKLAGAVKGDPEAALPYRRLSRPLLDAGGKGEMDPSRSTASVRIALFSNGDGEAATASEATLTSNAAYRLTAGGRTVKSDGKELETIKIVYRPENGAVEARDAAGNILFEADRPFRVEPASRFGSVMVRNARFSRSFGFDPGDRELRGSLEIVPSSGGFRLVNEVRLEDYLYGVVAAALPRGSPADAYKAQAVVARTIALRARADAALSPSPEAADLCDSHRCQLYIGVNTEIREASQAVAATEGLVLLRAGRLAKVSQHENCGGQTESGRGAGAAGFEDLVSVSDASEQTPAPASLSALERWTHDFPPADRYCAAQNLTPPVQARWVRILDASVLSERAARRRDIGAIRHLRVVRRSATGRVQAVEAVGSRGSLLLEGQREIEGLLSPGSLRSLLFTITPLPHGPHGGQFLLWGAGTGSGLGLCHAGAIGQASLGRDWRAILSHYFPGLTVGGAAARGNRGTP